MEWLGCDAERTEKSESKSRHLEKGLVKSEWILLAAIFVISVFTAFMYTRSQLEESERYSGDDVIYVTPTPEAERTPP